MTFAMWSDTKTFPCSVLAPFYTSIKIVLWVLIMRSTKQVAELVYRALCPDHAICTCSSVFIMLSCPMFLAQCQGLSPALLLASILAPRLSNSSAPSNHPSYAALCRAVLPAPSTSLTSSPLSTAFTMAAPEQRKLVAAVVRDHT